MQAILENSQRNLRVERKPESPTPCPATTLNRPNIMIEKKRGRYFVGRMGHLKFSQYTGHRDALALAQVERKSISCVKQVN